MSVKNNMSAIGYLGKDGEVRYAASGTAILNFSLPVESGWGDNKKTTWLNCVAFGKKAEGKLVEYLVKGQQVAVQGEINLNKYIGSDGVEKSSLELIVSDVALVGKAPQSQEGIYKTEVSAEQTAGDSLKAGGDDSDPTPF